MVLAPYCTDGEILHNSDRFVEVAWLQKLPLDQRHTLQLVKAAQFSARIVGKRAEGGDRWEGTLVTASGHCVTATITDPVFARRLELGHQPKSPCLVTVSLSMPWSAENTIEGDRCYKLIAGVIECDDHQLSSF